MSLRFAQSVLFLGLSFPIAVIAQAPGQLTAPAPPTAGVIRGVVTAASTGRPVRRAEIRVEGPTLPITEPRMRKSLASAGVRNLPMSSRKARSATASFSRSLSRRPPPLRVAE